MAVRLDLNEKRFVKYLDLYQNIVYRHFESLARVASYMRIVLEPWPSPYALNNPMSSHCAETNPRNLTVDVLRRLSSRSR